MHPLEIYLSEGFRTISFIVFCFLGNRRGFVEDEALLPMLLVIHVRCSTYEHFTRHVDITNERKKERDDNSFALSNALDNFL